MTGEQLRLKRVAAKISGYVVCERARIGRGRLSEIECGRVSPSADELTRIDRVITELIQARQKVAELAAEVGWPM